MSNSPLFDQYVSELEESGRFYQIVNWRFSPPGVISTLPGREINAAMEMLEKNSARPAQEKSAGLTQQLKDIQKSIALEEMPQGKDIPQGTVAALLKFGKFGTRPAAPKQPTPDQSLQNKSSPQGPGKK